MGNEAKFELSPASKYLWSGTILPDTKDSKEYGTILCVKISPNGEGLGAADAALIGQRMAELSEQNNVGIDPFFVWLSGEFQAPEGAKKLERGDKSLYYPGPIPGWVLSALIKQADKVELVRGRRYPKPTLKLSKGTFKKKADDKPKKPQLSW